MAKKILNDAGVSRLWSKIKTALDNKLDKTGNAYSASKLVTEQTIDGVGFNGSDGINHYFTCSTAAATAAKAASAADPTKIFVLATGAKVIVKFTYANTVASPTLNINAKGAKPIYWNGAALTSAQYWSAGSVLAFVYDGTNWNLIGIAKDNNTTYSAATTSASGLMTSAMVTKLNGIAEGANKTTVDTALSADSSNPVANSVINTALENKLDKTENAASATKLASKHYIDGMPFDGSLNVSHYFTCSTEAATAEKVTIVGDPTIDSNATLISGLRITVKFTNANTAANPTINFTVGPNSKGVKPIYWHGAALTSAQYWQAGAVLDFIYDGTNWNLIGVAKDNNTTYSAATTSANGLMTSAMVTKLNGIAAGANSTTVENVLTSTSATNALSAAQGKALNDTKANKATSLSGYGITDAYTKTQTDSAISAAVAGASHLKRSIVETLPTSGIDANTIYMILADDESSDNKYIEWMYINSNWEKVGDSDVDLSGYIKETDLVALTDAEIDAMCV